MRPTFGKKFKRDLDKHVRSGEEISDTDFVAEMADILQISKQDARKAFDVYNDLIFQHMALEDWIIMPYGIIGGYTKEPMKVTGFYNSLKSLQDPTRKYYTVAKSGFPFVIWSCEAEYSTITHPGIYYTEWVPQKYTTKAYNFRKELGYPEIDEFKNLDEEKIQEICEKADESLYGKKDKGKLIEEKRKKERSKIQKEIRDERIVMEYREAQLKKGIPEEQIEEKTAQQILEERYELWLDSKMARDGIYKCKTRGYKIPEKLMSYITLNRKLKRIEKYDNNDSVYNIDDRKLAELSKKRKEQEKELREKLEKEEREQEEKE